MLLSCNRLGFYTCLTRHKAFDYIVHKIKLEVPFFSKYLYALYILALAYKSFYSKIFRSITKIAADDYVVALSHRILLREYLRAESAVVTVAVPL